MEALLGPGRPQPTQLHQLGRQLDSGEAPDVPRGLLEANEEAFPRGLQRALESAEVPPRGAAHLAVALVAAQLRTARASPSTSSFAALEDVFGQVKRAASRFADHVVLHGAPHRAIAITAALAALPPPRAWTEPRAQATALVASATGSALHMTLRAPAPGSAASLDHTWALSARHGLQGAVDRLTGMVTCHAHAAVAAPWIDPAAAAAAALAAAATVPTFPLAPRLALCACLAHPPPTVWAAEHGEDSWAGERELRAFRAMFAIATSGGPAVAEPPQGAESLIAASRTACATVDAAVDSGGPLCALVERGCAHDAGLPADPDTERTRHARKAAAWVTSFVGAFRAACGALLACTPLLPHVAAAGCAAALRCAQLAAADPEGGAPVARAALALAIVRCDAGAVRACARGLARRVRARGRRCAALGFAAGLLLEALEAGSSDAADAGPVLAFAVLEGGIGFRAGAVAVRALCRSLPHAPRQGLRLVAAACEAYPLSVGAHSLGTAAAAVVRSCPDGDAAAAVETLGQRAVEAVAQARAHAVEAKAAVLRCAELAAQGRSPSPSDVRIPEAPPSRAWRARRGDAPSANATWRDTPWLLGSVPFSTAADEGGDEAGRAAAAGLASRVASHHLETAGGVVRSQAAHALEKVAHAWGPARRHHCTAVISHVALEQPGTPPHRRAAVATWLLRLVEGVSPASRL